MTKRLLIFAWEYNGYHSVQGAALARRIRQVAESFRAQGWDVTAIHRDQLHESKGQPFTDHIESNGIRRIAVAGAPITIPSQNAIARKISTFMFVAFYGDRSYKWAKEVIRNYDVLAIEKPDLIISFYTPKGPIYLGNYFSKKLNVPWIADIQDPILAGISGSLKSYARKWASRFLKPAKAIVHISPEWAKADEKEIGLKIQVIRHAVPDAAVQPVHGNGALMLSEYTDCFKIFYGGSITPRIQSVELLKKVIKSVGNQQKKIMILVAGHQNSYNYLKLELGDEMVRYLGWLSFDGMADCIFSCDCTLVVPWSKERVGIPSKFFEFCSFPKPVWIIGDDLGAFDSLMEEYGFKGLKINDFEFQKKALTAALRRDYSLFFNLDRCTGKIVRPADLCGEYLKLI